MQEPVHLTMVYMKGVAFRHKTTSEHSQLIIYTVTQNLSSQYVIGSEKRDHFVQNVNFWHFSNCHHKKTTRASDFWLGLYADEAFY